jgi:UPF0755 protein
MKRRDDDIDFEELQEIDGMEQFRPPSRIGRGIVRLFFVLFFLGIVGGLALAGGYWYYNKTLHAAVSEELQPLQRFVIPEGQPAGTIASRLKTEGLVSDSLVFRVALRLQHKGSTIQAGEYQLASSMTMQEIVDMLQEGNISERWMVIKDGWRVEEVAQYLNDEGIVDGETFMTLVKDYLYAADYDFLASEGLPGKPAATSLEGYLFPDNYLIPVETTPAQVLVVLLNTFNTKVWTEANIAKAEQISTDYSLNMYQIVTLASIVQREGRDLEEMQMVAAIYLNRLKQGMLLGACPTVLYALGDWKAELTYDNLQIDSPYNTRLYPGLPPGPICNPNLNAITAVLEPSQTDYLYFMTDKDGVMRYARTNEEHEQNKATYGVSGVD